MQGYYSPFDPKLPTELADRHAYIAARTDLSAAESLDLSLYVWNDHQRALTQIVKQADCESYKESSEQIAQWIQNSAFLCIFFTVLTFGRVNPQNWKYLVTRAAAEDDDPPDEITAQYDKDIVANLKTMREIEIKLGRDESISLPAKAIWNALGGRRETFPRFIVKSDAGAPSL